MIKKLIKKIKAILTDEMRPKSYRNHFRDNFLYFDGDEYFLVIGEREYGDFNFCIYDEVYHCDKNGTIDPKIKVDEGKAKEVIEDLICQLRLKGTQVFYNTSNKD